MNGEAFAGKRLFEGGEVKGRLRNVGKGLRSTRNSSVSSAC